jgi:phage shock protein PspC (stress-responsive transcriptional regulator)
LDSFFAALRRPGIFRVADGKWFAGVATGLARWLGVDPLVVRAGFILFSLFFGMGVALYLVLWLLLPTEDGSLAIERALRHGDGGAIFLLVVTVLSVFGGSNPGWRDDWAGLRIIGFIAVGAVVWWLLTRTDRGVGAGPPPAGTPTANQAAPTTYTDTGAPSPVSGATSMPTGSWASAGTTGPSAWQPPQPPQPRPLPTPRPTTPVMGFAAGAITLGAALVAGAGTTWLADRGDWAGNHVSLGMAAALAVIGLGALVAGLAGRRTGWIAPFAILGIIATLLSSVSPVGLRQPWRVGDNTLSPSTVQGAGPYELGAGQLNVDLSDAALDTDPTTVQTVQARVGAGELRLVVPDGTSVRVDAAARAGGLTAFESNEAPDSTLDAGGIDFERTIAYGTGPTQLVVEAEVGLGQIIIRKD